MTPEEIIQFWKDVGPARWYAVEPALDDEIRKRFEPAWEDARDDKLGEWENAPNGALALLLLLDQLSRNMFRGHAQAFSSDALARAVADLALAQGHNLATPKDMRAFFYLPLMHSEDLADQDRCVALIAERLGEDSTNYPFALGHRDIIRRFGRFPARNQALGRMSTPQEIAFLESQPQPG